MAPDRRTTERRNNYQADHDTIIRVETKLDIALEKIETLSEALTNGLARKLDAADFTTFKETTIRTITDEQGDHEKRLRKLETWAWTAIGALALIELVGFAYFIRLFG